MKVAPPPSVPANLTEAGLNQESFTARGLDEHGEALSGAPVNPNLQAVQFRPGMKAPQTMGAQRTPPQTV